MNISEEVRISEYQHVVFIAESELAELYDAMSEHWRLDRDDCKVFAASIFYNLGRVHGIREERAKKKARAVS